MHPEGFTNYRAPVAESRELKTAKALFPPLQIPQHAPDRAEIRAPEQVGAIVGLAAGIRWIQIEQRLLAVMALDEFGMTIGVGCGKLRFVRG